MVGKIYKGSAKSCQLRILTKELFAIIAHFNKYPLLSLRALSL
jgi:hypothetical protein